MLSPASKKTAHPKKGKIVVALKLHMRKRFENGTYREPKRNLLVSEHLRETKIHVIPMFAAS